MERKLVVVNNEVGGASTPTDINVTLDPPLNLHGKWSSHLSAIHFSWIYPDGTSANKVDSPIYVIADFIDASRVNGANVQLLGTFNLDFETEDKLRFYKRKSLTFVRDRYVPVVKQYLPSIRIRLLNSRMCEVTPSVFRGITTLEIEFRKDV